MDVHRVCIEKDKREETFIVRVKGRAGRKSRDHRAAPCDGGGGGGARARAERGRGTRRARRTPRSDGLDNFGPINPRIF